MSPTTTFQVMAICVLMWCVSPTTTFQVMAICVLMWCCAVVNIVNNF